MFDHESSRCILTREGAPSPSDIVLVLSYKLQTGLVSTRLHALTSSATSGHAMTHLLPDKHKLRLTFITATRQIQPHEAPARKLRSYTPSPDSTPMPEISESDLPNVLRAALETSDVPFIQNLREGPTAALEHLRALYQTRAPGPVSKSEELSACARSLFVHFISSSRNPHDPDDIAEAIGPELRRACFESEILLLFAEMMANRDFLRHFSVRYTSLLSVDSFITHLAQDFTVSITRCTLILLRVWILEMDQPSEHPVVISPEFTTVFFDKIELACSVLWDERSCTDNLHDKNTGVILAELQGAFWSICTIKALIMLRRSGMITSLCVRRLTSVVRLTRRVNTP